MKKIITAAVLTAMASLAHAHTGEPGEASVKLALDSYNEEYTEYETSKNDALFMKETATMAGINGVFSFQATESIQFNVKGRYAVGSSRYTGAMMGGTYGSVVSEGQARSVWEFGAEYKQKFEELNDINFGVGFNYRELTDRLDQAGAGGYKRVNGITYAVVSLEKEFKAGSWRITPKVAGEILMNGTQKSYLDPQVALEHKQSKGNGHNLEVNFSRKVGRNILSITPHFRTMTIDNSSVVIVSDGVTDYTTMEPKNKTVEAGVTVGMTF